MTMILRWFAALAICTLHAASASAQAPPPSSAPRQPAAPPPRQAAQADYTRATVEGISVQAFLQRSARFSENLVGAKKSLFNSIIGEGDIGEPSEDVLVTVTFGGKADPAGVASVPPKAASVTITARNPSGAKVLLKTTEGGFLFGPGGRFSKVYLLRGATCSPLIVEASSGASKRTATVDFRCGE
jgi:hypothetical protein